MQLKCLHMIKIDVKFKHYEKFQKITIYFESTAVELEINFEHYRLADLALNHYF